MPLSADALTTVAHMRAYLQRSRTDTTAGRFTDAEMEALIESTSAAIAGYTQRQLIAPTLAQFYTLSATDSVRLQLPEWPIVAISSLTIDGGDEIDWIASDDDYLAGIITLKNTTSGVPPQLITCVARLGYDPTAITFQDRISRAHKVALAQLESACLQWAAMLFTAPIPSAETVQVDQVAFTVRESEIPMRVRGILQGYVRYAI